tara:strand:+ start:647 stop:1156 length:510 start_codon:yes stop_codon:yes gene_type:complete
MDYAYIKDEAFEKELGIDITEIDSVETKDRRVLNKQRKPVVVLGGDEDINRAAVECKNVDVLLCPERNRKGDGLHQRRSGLNQVLCKLARKNKVAIGFSFNLVLSAKGKERAKIIGRMRQNVRLCRKYQADMVLGSFAARKYELRSRDCLKAFGFVLGMTGKEVKNALA